jgi:peroxiredoxin
MLYIDDTTKLSNFADEHKLPYMLISDKDGQARKDYMVSKSLFGLAEGKSYSLSRYRTLPSYYPVLAVLGE